MRLSLFEQGQEGPKDNLRERCGNEKRTFP